MMRYVGAVIGLFLGIAYTQTARFELVIPKTCVKSAVMGDKFECSGPDNQHMSCRGLILTFHKECEELRVVK